MENLCLPSAGHLEKTLELLGGSRETDKVVAHPSRLLTHPITLLMIHSLTRLLTRSLTAQIHHLSRRLTHLLSDSLISSNPPSLPPSSPSPPPFPPPTLSTTLSPSHPSPSPSPHQWHNARIGATPDTIVISERDLIVAEYNEHSALIAAKLLEALGQQVPGLPTPLYLPPFPSLYLLYYPHSLHYIYCTTPT